MTNTQRRILIIPLVVLALVVSACSDDGSDGASDESTSTTTAASTSAPAGFGDVEGTDALPALPDEVARPIVFVHGFAGSAQQYESQAMRFAANGYPQDRIVAFEHDGAGFDIEGYAKGLSDFIDQTLADTGAKQVYLVGHSRGTGVSEAYLGDPAHVAKVAKLIVIDGAPCIDVVPCLAPNQALFPGQAHVETATSPESFEAQYEFLVGQKPKVVDIAPQRDPVVLNGRAVEFPANTGRAGAQLDIWKIDDETGQRIGSKPHATFDLGDDGAFGPVEVQTGAHYEWLLTSDQTKVQHHLYLQPYLRSSNFVRLLSSAPDGPTRSNTNVGPDHVALIIMRMREWYAVDDPDLPGDQHDSIEIHSGPDDDRKSVAGLEPFVGNGTIAVHVHDDAATPGENSEVPLPYFSEQPFQSGVDRYIAADPEQTVAVYGYVRGDRTEYQRLNFPAWPSSEHSVSVVFTDWPVDPEVD